MVAVRDPILQSVAIAAAPLEAHSFDAAEQFARALVSLCRMHQYRFAASIGVAQRRPIPYQYNAIARSQAVLLDPSGQGGH